MGKAASHPFSTNSRLPRLEGETPASAHVMPHTPSAPPDSAVPRAVVTEPSLPGPVSESFFLKAPSRRTRVPRMPAPPQLNHPAQDHIPTRGCILQGTPPCTPRPGRLAEGEEGVPKAEEGTAGFRPRPGPKSWSAGPQTPREGVSFPICISKINRGGGAPQLLWGQAGWSARGCGQSLQPGDIPR